VGVEQPADDRPFARVLRDVLDEGQPTGVLVGLTQPERPGGDADGLQEAGTLSVCDGGREGGGGQGREPVLAEDVGEFAAGDVEKHGRNSELGGTGAVGLLVDGNGHDDSLANRGASGDSDSQRRLTRPLAERSCCPRPEVPPPSGMAPLTALGICAHQERSGGHSVSDIA
jgi:hypothetical protein